MNADQPGRAAPPTAADLVPGDPDGLDALAAHLDRFGGRAHDAVQQVRRLDPDHWSGAAALRFRAAVEHVPAHLVSAGDAFARAHRSLRSYAAALRQSQASAGYALELIAHADVATAAWRAAGAVGPDPGADERQTGQRLIEAARERAATAARTAAGHLTALAAGAPAPALSAAGTVRSGDATIRASSRPDLSGTDRFAHADDSGTTGLRYGSAHQVGFANGADGGPSWQSWVAAAPGRELGSVPIEVAGGLAAGLGAGGMGVLAGAIARRRRRTAMALAGVDPARLAPQRSTRARSIGGQPSRVGAGWRTNLSRAPRSHGLGHPSGSGARLRASDGRADVPVVVAAPSAVRHQEAPERPT